MTPLNLVKGLGSKRIELLKSRGIETAEDLAGFFPSSYYDLSVCAPANAPDPDCVVIAEAVTEPSVRFVRKGLSIAKFSARDPYGNTFSVVFYNRPYLKNQVTVGKSYYFFGALDGKRALSMANPILEPADPPPEKTVFPVYPILSGIPKSTLREAIAASLAKGKFVSIIPAAMRQHLPLLDLEQAYKTLHAPRSQEDIALASTTVAVEELVQLLLAFRFNKEQSGRARGFLYADSSAAVGDVVKKLSFTLTECQRAALSEILMDLRSATRMNRLLQGDVGSGKTIIAFLALYFVALSGRQAVLMCPTEVLARQHFQNFAQMFPSLPAAFLSAGMNAADTAASLSRIADGSAKIIVGTHSLFQDRVVYDSLSLVVTDEQHRFGVAQRRAIESKGGGAVDTLIMSATPIPRTLALVIYGDLDVSTLDQKPSGRQEISTKYVPESKINDMYKFMLEQAEKGFQSYIVLPRVEDDAESSSLPSVKAMHEKLSKTVFADIGVGLLYGGMPEKQKNSVLNDFACGQTKILISTTVIEVGIDVANATIIAIFGADRFGLAQLHQLRGRVGRSDVQSHCFLLPVGNSSKAKARLDRLKSCSDGFALAEYDLETRGAGDFIGVDQHGLGSALSNLRFGKAAIDLARALSSKLLRASDFSPDKLSPRARKLVGRVTLN